MSDPGAIAGARIVVVKIGSSLLVESAGRLREEWLAGLAADAAHLHSRGQGVVLVSSGAIALGRGILGYPAGPLILEHSQAAAAAGQIRLAQAYATALAPHDLTAAQILLTLGDTQNRRRYLNARATLNALLSVGAVPVVNENDTVATDEIRFGDNDRLAARVALMVGADLLVMLSDVDGLYTVDPRQQADAVRIPDVREITDAMLDAAGATGSDDSRGGMRTKLLAAQVAMQGGCLTAVARGDVVHPVRSLEQGAACTWFHPVATSQAARKQWIAGMKPCGTLVVDAGAVQALRNGRSLLPVGLRSVEGGFARGDPVQILGEGNGSVGAGLVAYSARDARRIAGLPTTEIVGVLGHPGRDELVHRDDMVLWGRP